MTGRGRSRQRERPHVAAALAPPNPGLDQRGGRRRTRFGPRLAVPLGVLAVVVQAITGMSVLQALTAPGSASWSTRLVDWVRDHGGGSVVDSVEVWWYTRQPPGNAPPLAPRLPVTWGVSSPASAPLPVPTSLAGTGMRGAGVWVPVGRLDHGQPVLWATWLAPDPRHRSVTTVVVRADPRRVTTRLIAGTIEPGGTAWPEGAQVPAADRGRVIAAFNGGFRFQDAPGGFAADGRVAHPLVAGLASAVIGADGSLDVRRWHAGPAPGPNVAAVRQNLDPIVENFRPVVGLATNADGRWGSPSNQLEYTWRSGLGVAADGTLLYAAGRGLTLSSLARALAAAGARTAMELDIHTVTVTFNLFYRDGPSGLRGDKLVAQMARPATRYLSPDQRDFFEVLLR